jgi:2-polyprenyl-6-methoxyphenol hydroxylase-like FAD-dependent oxidoreductase
MRNDRGTGTAVVIGASMAGLGAARVLSERFGSVTVLDRDTLPDDNTPRRGVPQGSHGHILLVSGLRELATLFDGLEDELLAAGGTRFDPGLALRAYQYGRRSPTAPTGLEMIAMSRPLLEAVIRNRVAKLAGVTIRDQVAVTGLASADGRVTGVVLDNGETLTADLTVDCSGRGSRSDRWLADLGLPAPERVEVKAGVSYSTRTYRRRPGDLPDGVAFIVLPEPPGETMIGLVMPIEDDRWLIGLGGWHLDNPPTDPESFEAFVRALPDPAIAEVMDRAEPLTDPVIFRYPSSRRRLFERLAAHPAGYLALGDAICSFNPIYGQGMTCAAREAVALGATLDKHRDATAEMARDYYRAASKVIATPWQFAVGGDFVYPQTTGPKPRGIKLSNWYARQIGLASQIAPDINATFQSVQQLITPPGVLFRPAMIVRVLRLARRRLSEEAPSH